MEIYHVIYNLPYQENEAWIVIIQSSDSTTFIFHQLVKTTSFSWCI